MLIEKIAGVLSNPAYAASTVDYVDIEWHETFKRIHRKLSHGGREIAMRFADDILTRGLRQDDVLAVDGDIVVAVNIMPCPVLVIVAKDSRQSAKVCYEIGNKHLPLFYGQQPDEFIIPYDKTIEDFMRKIHVAVRTEAARLDYTNSVSSGGLHAHTH